MKRALCIILIVIVSLMGLLVYMIISAEQLKKIDGTDAIAYPVWNKVLPDRIEVYSVKDNRTYTARYSFTGYIDGCSIDKDHLLYENDSLKGGGTGTVEVKDISKGAFHRTEKLDIYDYCIVADSIIATDYNGILE